MSLKGNLGLAALFLSFLVTGCSPNPDQSATPAAIVAPLKQESVPEPKPTPTINETFSGALKEKVLTSIARFPSSVLQAFADRGIQVPNMLNAKPNLEVIQSPDGSFGGNFVITVALDGGLVVRFVGNIGAGGQCNADFSSCTAAWQTGMSVAGVNLNYHAGNSLRSFVVDDGNDDASIFFVRAIVNPTDPSVPSTYYVYNTSLGELGQGSFNVLLPMEQNDNSLVIKRDVAETKVVLPVSFRVGNP